MPSTNQTPVLVGIAGGTGSGKSTVAANIAAGLPADKVAVIDHDSYYKHHPDMPMEERELLNYDHPDSLDNELFIKHLDMLRAGQSVEVPSYDFRTHGRTQATRTLLPAPVVIVEGILVFVDEAIRDRLDVKVFVDTDSDIRVIRRIRRDMEARGRTFQQVREQYYKTVRPMHLQFVEPSKRWADIIIPEGGNNRVALDLVLGKLLQI
ncbi:MAG: uridine kinase [Deltaproteobacteria bacterium]|jgi:uridine kinase|nr:uridine kinase [Deltaproteobacteria bacterium]MBT6432304.1 uridine kinase [Deltaproteobacteria bacterium]MBT6488477.1 uridine kinase [Deltaproteobacteria bacterium]